MPRFRIRIFVFWIVLLATPAQLYAVVRIEVGPAASIQTATVHVGDVATVESDDNKLTASIEALDLTILNGVGDSTTLAQSLIQVRLAVAGIDSSAYVLSGAKQVEVTRRERMSTEQDALALLKQALAELWGVNEVDVLVSLVRPLKRDVANLAEENFEIKPLLAQPPRLGANQFRFGAYKHGGLQTTFLASVDVQLVKELALAKQMIPAGKVITENDIELRRKPFRDRDALFASADVVGKEAARTIRPGDYVSPAFIRRPRAAIVGKKIVVKRRARIRLIAVKGALTVSIPQAEALDDGAVGETIRVRNLQSGKIVTGQVKDSQSVKISL